MGVVINNNLGAKSDTCKLCFDLRMLNANIVIFQR